MNFVKISEFSGFTVRHLCYCDCEIKEKERREKSDFLNIYTVFIRLIARSSCAWFDILCRCDTCQRKRSERKVSSEAFSAPARMASVEKCTWSFPALNPCTCHQYRAVASHRYLAFVAVQPRELCTCRHTLPPHYPEYPTSPPSRVAACRSAAHACHYHANKNFQSPVTHTCQLLPSIPQSVWWKLRDFCCRCSI